MTWLREWLPGPPMRFVRALAYTAAAVIVTGLARPDFYRPDGDPLLEEGREQTRWFPAMVSNHVMDLIERYGTDGSVIPRALTDFVEARKFYDYDEHSRVGAAHGEFVTDEICDRFSVLGDVDQITTKLRELESIGVDHFSIYLMTHGQEETLEAYGSHVIPSFSGATA